MMIYLPIVIVSKRSLVGVSNNLGIGIVRGFVNAEFGLYCNGSLPINRESKKL